MRLFEVIVYIGLLGSLAIGTAFACAIVGTYVRGRRAGPGLRMDR